MGFFNFSFFYGQSCHVIVTWITSISGECIELYLYSLSVCSRFDSKLSTGVNFLISVLSY